MSIMSQFSLVNSSKRLGVIYEKILQSDLIKKKILTPNTIKTFQNYLNEAQPKTNDEHTARKIIHFLYRKNNNSFSRYLHHAKLPNLILWTDERCIVKHFYLRRVLYIEWDGKSYKCDIHRGMNKLSQSKANRSRDNNSYYHSNTNFPNLTQNANKQPKLKNQEGDSYATILKKNDDDSDVNSA